MWEVSLMPSQRYLDDLPHVLPKEGNLQLLARVLATGCLLEMGPVHHSAAHKYDPQIEFLYLDLVSDFYKVGAANSGWNYRRKSVICIPCIIIFDWKGKSVDHEDIALTANRSLSWQRGWAVTYSSNEVSGALSEVNIKFHYRDFTLPQVQVPRKHWFN